MKYILAVLSLAILAACNSVPTLQSGPNAEVTFDGLVRVDNTRLDAVWIRPGIDLSAYDKLTLVGAGIKYRSVREVRRLNLSNDSEFPLDARQRERIEESVREVFSEEMAKIDGFEITMEDGPGTLALTGTLIDVVSFVPPDRLGNVDYYLSSLGAATLILELSDSMSGQVLARAADGRSIDVEFVTRSNTVSNRFELERELDRWADVIRNGLESLTTTPILPAEE